MNVRINIRLADLDRLANRLPERIDRGIARIAYACEAGAVRTAPVGHGSLRSSIAVRKQGPSSYIVGPNARSNRDGAPYDVFQEFGTGMLAEDFDGKALGTRHRIYPRTAKMLVFTWKGRTWRLPSVAGNPAIHYMRKGMEEAMKDSPRHFSEGFVSVGI